jgi:hypothetical protein
MHRLNAKKLRGRKGEEAGREILIGWMGSVTMFAGWERLRVQGPSF